MTPTIRLLPLLPLLVGCTVVLPPGAIGPSGAPAAGASPGPAASPAASPTPTATTSAGPAPAASPGGLGPITGKVLFADGFEAGLAKWHVNQGKRLRLEAVIGGASEGQAAVAFSDDEAQVPAGVADTANLVMRAPLDLSALVLPRLRLHVKGGAQPEAAGTVQAVWLDQATYDPATIEIWGASKDVGGPVPGRAAWAGRDLDLSAFKGKPGFLRLRFDAAATNGAAYPGLRLDQVAVYDAGTPDPAGPVPAP